MLFFNVFSKIFRHLNIILILFININLLAFIIIYTNNNKQLINIEKVLKSILYTVSYHRLRLNFIKGMN